MSDLKAQIANTKSIQEVINVFNNASNEFLENISNVKYSDAVTHIDKLIMSLIDVKKDGKLTWDAGFTGVAVDEKKFEEKNLHYHHLGSETKTTITHALYTYAENKLKDKPVELSNYREALIRTATEYGKMSIMPEPETIMTERVNFRVTEKQSMSVAINSKTNYVPTPDPIPTEKMPTNIDSESALQKEIANTKSMDDLIKVLNKEVDKILPGIENKKYSDVVKNIDHWMMNLVHAIQEGNMEWHADNGKFSWNKHTSYNNLNTQFTQAITYGIYMHVENELGRSNKLVETSNFREALIRTITEYNKFSSQPEPETLMSENARPYRLQSTAIKTRVFPKLDENIPEGNTNFSAALQTSLNLKGTLDKMRNNGTDADKKNGLKNN